MLALTVLL